MGYRSNVLWVAIVPSIKEANECIKAYMVLTKLEQTQPPYPDDVKGVFVVDTQDDPAYITYVGREVKWYESYEDVDFINKFFSEYVEEYFNVKDMSWGSRFFRITIAEFGPTPRRSTTRRYSTSAIVIRSWN